MTPPAIRPCPEYGRARDGSVMWNAGLMLWLRDMWSLGLTATRIGKMSGISKNAVIGKAHRLRLEGRPSPIGRGLTPAAFAPPAPPAVPDPPARQERPVTAILPLPVPSPPVTPPPPPRGCQFPLWPHQGRPQFRADGAPLLCGEPTGRVYCEAHARACYARAGAA